MEIIVPKIGRVSENQNRPVHPMLHVTHPRNLQSILKNGFIMPDSMRNGATYGAGVYFANINAPVQALPNDAEQLARHDKKSNVVFGSAHRNADGYVSSGRHLLCL
jgi:hypothetical protein